MSAVRNYDLKPVIQVNQDEVNADEASCLEGWDEISEELHDRIGSTARFVVAIECYPGVMLANLQLALKAAFPTAKILNVELAYRSASVLRGEFDAALTNDPVFGVMHPWKITQLFDGGKLDDLRAEIGSADGLTFLIGSGTREIAQTPDLLLHAGVTRWELQRRQRTHTIGNLGLIKPDESASQLYKRAYFVDWRIGDEIRHAMYAEIDYFLDLDDQETPRMVRGDLLRTAVAETVKRPFRVEPFFDPGPWGGQWMKEKFGLPDGPPNYAWCFDCVPEENSVTFGFGSRRFHLPAIVLVHEQPEALLGEAVYRQFGAEFPIRFDLLDTVGGGSLSLQVHPLKEYIAEHFGMKYTQDESYYILDCEPDSELYLGLKEGVDRDEMRRNLAAAQRGQSSFEATDYVNVWPTQKHDHFSIPAGTIHCSGSGNLVLEISATPYIFTFKLWDWGRVGLDGKPRPIHLKHGLANLQWERDTAWVKAELLDQVVTVAEGRGWREERTGLHVKEFLETRRTWFTEAVPHDTEGALHVLNLVEGDAAVVESPTEAFAPFEVHYAETFIIPAAVGPYVVRPLGEVRSPLATIKAYVRQD
ncbi:mannose-6-phosphate isomerase class I [Granulicella aggregans]|uniref:Mannose-6-phosphate isomerase class I n=1 Tax=Granulicella aggregans TaxID=474949 RepID=A0A7W8E479_9BACT|nr:class I mannose-6-phosphate isomerase [Granulicella aggregans]MBB5058024.1 mannose-6-phosphate isomerase class I [Granulicella aggregans]